MQTNKLWLVVECVNVRGPTVHENEYDSLDPWWKMQALQCTLFPYSRLSLSFLHGPPAPPHPCTGFLAKRSAKARPDSPRETLRIQLRRVKSTEQLISAPRLLARPFKRWSNPSSSISCTYFPIPKANILFNPNKLSSRKQTMDKSFHNLLPQ